VPFLNDAVPTVRAFVPLDPAKLNGEWRDPDEHRLEKVWQKRVVKAVGIEPQ
jgi:hypothetical protein